MILSELIEYLRSKDKNTKVKKGFNYPHSYRGYYEELAFEPCDDTTVGEMLECAQQALDNTYTGWKGGEFRMNGFSECYIAYAGNTGEGIGPILLDFMTEEK